MHNKRVMSQALWACWDGLHVASLYFGRPIHERYVKKRMNYFRRIWDESRCDEYDYWGNSEWYFEADEEGYITKNLQIYQNGIELYYSNSHVEDKYGVLPEGALDLGEFSSFSITKQEFETIISNAKPINRENT